MKLLLHIGSHKTASTSIQHFCALNRHVLADAGFFYPHNKHSAYVFNFLASNLAYSKQELVEDFMQQCFLEASEAGAHTVIISAESFFAMTTFFQDIPKNIRQIEDYWDNEKALIQTLKACCKDYKEIDVVCYLRPQDELASSLYNQFVKNTFGISSSYNEFIEIVRPIFSYDRHIALWQEIFGKTNVYLQNFIECKKDPVEEFCEKYIAPECYEKADKKDLFSNTRLSRDVLEYKRIYNATNPDRSHAYVAARCFRDISDSHKDFPGYQVFAPYKERSAYFKDFEDGNKALCDEYGLSDLPTLRNMKEPTYPSLSKEKELLIKKQFYSVLNKPKNRGEIAIRQFFNCVLKIPGGAVVIQPIRVLNNKLRLKLSGW